MNDVISRVKAWVDKEAHDIALGYTINAPIADISLLIKRLEVAEIGFKRMIHDDCEGEMKKYWSGCTGCWYREYCRERSKADER